jgi:segregation and condensation protein B
VFFLRALCALCGEKSSVKPAATQFGSVATRYRHTLAGTAGLGGAQRICQLRLGVSATATPQPLESLKANRLSRRARLEAVLLLAREPLTLRKLAEMANLADGTEARSLIEELRKVHAARGSAFQVVRVAGGRQLLTRPDLAPWLSAAVPPADDLRLSPPALETLAVVAYRQPAVRAEIESIRGVQCGDLLRQLMERELLRIVGRSADLGRPILYGTTKKFLQVFGLQSLDELPRAAELRKVVAGDSAPRTSEVFTEAA